MDGFGRLWVVGYGLWVKFSRGKWQFAEWLDEMEIEDEGII